MIEIDLKLFVTLARFHPDSKSGSGPFRMPQGSTVGDLVQILEIPEETVKLIFVNGKKAGSDQMLSQGDRVGLFPPVGGG